MKLEELYKKVFVACVQFAVYQKKQVQKDIEKILPDLKKFTNDFFVKNKYGIQEEDYIFLQKFLLNILQDFMEGMENRDRVLLEDTLEYGLKPFLELFFDEQDLIKLREETMDE